MGQAGSSPMPGWPGLLPKPEGQQLPLQPWQETAELRLLISFVSHTPHLRHNFLIKTTWALSCLSQEEFAGSPL